MTMDASMNEPSYDPQTRSRLCAACGAINGAPMAGGDLTCAGCGGAISVPPRVLQPLGDPLPARGKSPADLQSRLERYRQTLDRCLSHSSAPEERRLYWLTNKLNNIYAQRAESVKAWGAIQTSMDTLADEGYQQILRCMSADKARKADQLDHAEAWLALCNPTPGILDLDYNYRSSKAMLHGARGQWSEVLALVGESDDDVPFPPAGRAVKGCLRVTALEELQRHEAAEKAIQELLVAMKGLEPTLVRMCRPGNLFAPVTRVWRRVDRKTGGRKRRLGMAALVVGALGLGFFGWVLLKQSRHHASYKAVDAKVVKVHSQEFKERGYVRIGVGVDYSYQVNGKTYTAHRVTHDKRYYTFQTGHNAEKKMLRLRASRPSPPTTIRPTHGERCSSLQPPKATSTPCWSGQAPLCCFFSPC